MTGLQIITTTQQYRRTPSGEFWRECIARRTATGELRVVLVRDDILARAA